MLGPGEPARLGEESRAAIKNSLDQQVRSERIRTGKTSNLFRGRYGVDVTREKFFIGRTAVEYQTDCAGGECTTTFTGAVDDGFWDPIGKADGPGPRGEIPPGKPYYFVPFQWTMTFRDPRTR